MNQKFTLWLVLFLSLIQFQFGCSQTFIPGVYDSETKTFSPEQEKYQVSQFVDGLAVIRKKDKFGVINEKGRLIRPIKEEIVFLPIYAHVKGDPKKLTPGGPEQLGVLRITDPYNGGPNSACTVGDNGTYFVVNGRGEIVIPHRLIWKEAEYGFMMSRGREDRFVFQVYRYDEKSLPCLRCGKCYGAVGLADLSGNILLLEEQYQRIGSFFNDRAPVTNQDNKKGFIDANGKEVIPCEYDWVGSFKEGYAWVKKGGEKFKIDPDGKRLPD